jgi:hypothetical protein
MGFRQKSRDRRFMERRESAHCRKAADGSKEGVMERDALVLHAPSAPLSNVA